MHDKLKHLPRAYAFPKDKNLEKGRPIVIQLESMDRSTQESAAGSSKGPVICGEKTGGGWPTGNIYAENMHRPGKNTNV